MRNRITIVTAFLVLMLMAGTASASKTYNLTHSNIAELDGAVVVEVTVDDVHNTISVQLKTNPLTNTPLGIDTFFYNLEKTITKVDDPGMKNPWQTNFGGKEADGFGQFESKKSHSPAGEGGIDNPIVFTLENFSGVNIPKNNNNATVAVHIRFDDCSGWISDGISNDVKSEPKCKEPKEPPVSVPEFPTIALPIAAIMGLVFFAYRRNRKEE